MKIIQDSLTLLGTVFRETDHSDKTGNWEIYTARLQNDQLQNIQQITNRPTFTDRLPSFSSSSDRILFRAEEVGKGIESSRIYVLNLSTQAVQKLSGDSSDRFPNWSPDNQQIVFVSNRGAPGDNIYLMRSDGTNIRRLTFAAINDYPVFSPDGALVLFSSKIDGPYSLYLLQVPK